MISGFAQIRFYEPKRNIDVTSEQAFLTPIIDNPLPVNWDHSEKAETKISDLQKIPIEGLPFTDLPSAAFVRKNYAEWEKDFSDWLFRTQKMHLLRSPCLNQLSLPGEIERDFRVRLQQGAREKRDEQVIKLREKYSSAFARLDEKIRRAQMALDQQKAQASGQKYQVAASIGESLLSSFLGRRSNTRATRATRDIARSMKESRDKQNAEANLEALKKERARLETQFQSEVATAESKINPLIETLETVSVSASKSNIDVQLLALVWTAG
jgi:hypothetical protein